MADAFQTKNESTDCTKRGCTLGFSATFNGKQGSITASHCIDESKGIAYTSAGFISAGDSDWWSEAQCNNACSGQSGGNVFAWAALRPYYRNGKPDHDLGFVREKYASTETSFQIYANGDGWYNVWGLESDSSFPALGTTVCHSSGKFTAAGPGEYCGEVTDWVDFASSGSTTQNWTEVDPFQTNNQAGASGGPWYRSYSGSSVVGMGIHTASTADNTRNTYERIQPVRDALAGEASVTIYCNRGSGQVACLVNH